MRKQNGNMKTTEQVKQVETSGIMSTPFIRKGNAKLM